MLRAITCVILLISSLSILYGQTANDTMTIVKELDEIEVVQERSSSFVEQRDNQLVISARDISDMPKFLGTSDPLRYVQSLSGVQTNNESNAGIHIQGCDDYQSLISINAAPVYYPNHLMGLFSVFVAPHFSTIVMEQAEHKGTMENRVGGSIDFRTPNIQPARFSIEGNIGLISSDATLTIPCGKKNALFISARTSYINLLYGRWFKVEDYSVAYHFQDYNLSYVSQLTEKDKLVLSGFYSRDKMRVSTEDNLDVPVLWQNIVGSVYWNHLLPNGNWRTTVNYSYFDNNIQIAANEARVYTKAMFSSLGLKNKLDYYLLENLDLTAVLNYEQYLVRPMQYQLTGIQLYENESVMPLRQYASDLGAGLDLHHTVVPWFDYNAGFYSSVYISPDTEASTRRTYFAFDPRVTMHFHPAPHHSLSLHYGMYHQQFHKTGLTSGGLPTDFFILASEPYLPEMAHALNLRYSADFLNGQYAIRSELYFKQIYHTVEATTNVLQLLNKSFTYDNFVASSDGRNFGLNLMFQRTRGIVTGYVSYTLGWALRSIPSIEGKNGYIYSASHERRHDLKLVINSHFAKRWHIGGMFVLASGLPFTWAEEAYVFNGNLYFKYGKYNGARMALYHRLDLSVSCDIIKTPEHELGINLSLYNVYAHKNQQFVLYKDNISPITGTQLVTIIPSLSLYGKF